MNLIVKSSITLMSYLSFFLLPIWDELVIVAAVVTVDLILGVWKAIKKGEKVQSRGFQVTISKIAIYSITILLGHGIDIVFFEGSCYVVKLFAGAVVLTEFKSIIENVEELTGVEVWVLIKDFVSFKKIKL